MLIVNSGIIHEVSNIAKTEVEVICLLISYDFLKENIIGFDNITYKLNKEKIDYDQFKEVFTRILDNSYKESIEANLKIKSDLFWILSELNRNHTDEHKVAVEKDNDFIIEVIEWMHNHYDKPLSLNDASDNFNISREHFSRIF